MNKMVYAGDDGGTGPSHALWKDCPVAEIHLDPNVGYGFFDDFLRVPQFTDGATSYFNGYAGYVDTSVTFAPQADVVGGIIEVTNAADNDEAVLSGNAPAFQVSDTAGEDRHLWFEARVKRASVADNACAMFVGLAWDHTNGVSVAKTLCLTENDGALGDFSFLGFHVDAANGDAIDFVYKAANPGTQTVLIAGVDVPVLNTFANLGFYFNPQADAAKRITIFVDNDEQSTYVTKALIEAAAFPDAEPMAPAWCAKVGTAAESKAQMDWIRCYQMR